jgi:hypothetical protein
MRSGDLPLKNGGDIFSIVRRLAEVRLEERRVIRRRSRDGELREVVVSPVEDGFSLRPNLNRLDMGNGGKPIVVADKELVGDLTVVVQANHSPHDSVVLPVDTLRINATDVAHPSQHSTRQRLLPVLQRKVDGTDLGIDVELGNEAVVRLFVTLHGDDVAVETDGRALHHALTIIRRVEL